MKPQVIAIAVAAALVAEIGAASAADVHAVPNKSMSQTTQPTAQDNLTLTRSQQRTTWQDLRREASNQTTPPNFAASVGATIPGDMPLKSVPDRVATRVSALKPYDYAVIGGKLLIVNPNDKKVVDVINRRAWQEIGIAAF